MKKTICLLLAVLILLSLAACGGNSAQSAGTTTPTAPPTTGGNNQPPAAVLQIGFGKEKIMPTESVPLGGYGNAEDRMSQDLVDYLYGSCIAVTDEEKTLLLFSVDAIRSNQKWTDELCKRITAELNIPGENVMLMSTHTHSAPELNSELPCITEGYWEVYMTGLVAAAKAALEDRAPATLYGGTIKVDGMNFVRHYEKLDGTFVGSNFGDWTGGAAAIKGPAADNDPEMALIKIVREGDKKDILLMNWGAHPCFTGGAAATNLSADYIGAIRSYIEKRKGMEFFFILAAAGNQNAVSSLAAFDHGLGNKQYGEKLAKTAVDALDSLTKIEGSGVTISHKEIEYATKMPANVDPERKKQAQEVVDLWNSTGDREIANALAVQYGFGSVYEASSYLDDIPKSDTGTIPLDVTQFGGIAFVHAPYEMFAAEGVTIKENSPFGLTIIATQSNHGFGYFPSAPAYEFNGGTGCYESFGAAFAKGCAEDTAAELINMLKAIK